MGLDVFPEACDGAPGGPPEPKCKRRPNIEISLAQPHKELQWEENCKTGVKLIKLNVGDEP